MTTSTTAASICQQLRTHLTDLRLADAAELAARCRTPGVRCPDRYARIVLR